MERDKAFLVSLRLLRNTCSDGLRQLREQGNRKEVYLPKIPNKKKKNKEVSLPKIPNKKKKKKSEKGRLIQGELPAASAVFLDRDSHVNIIFILLNLILLQVTRIL